MKPHSTKSLEVEIRDLFEDNRIFLLPEIVSGKNHDNLLGQLNLVCKRNNAETFSHKMLVVPLLQQYV